ncbi:hypothetical protein CVT26_014448 [Gymnopilus dilepis]|uniref:DUF6534 domain-containing protein n=1 Tax=Gymnopilus dilepis TaxID=231916 RepID=A0A409VV67_9AGAR|nr:hypothetical protein CVT26_014448 [Gymnopilus dilepis]
MDVCNHRLGIPLAQDFWEPSGLQFSSELPPYKLTFITRTTRMTGYFRRYLALNTVHLVAITHGMYHYMISDFRNPEGLEYVVWYVDIQACLTIEVLIVFHSLYSLRIWKLGQRFSRIWPCLVIFVVIGGYGTRSKPLTICNGYMRWAIEASFSTSTGIDVILAFAMCICLYKNRTPFRKYASTVYVETFKLSTKKFLHHQHNELRDCLGHSYQYVTMRDTMIFLGISFLLTKLYISSYMAMLNARRPTREQESSSYNVSQFTKLRNVRPHDPTATNPGRMPPKTEVDSFQMSALDYRTKMDEEFSPGATVSRKASSSAKSAIIGITVHTTEERHYE